MHSRLGRDGGEHESLGHLSDNTNMNKVLNLNMVEVVTNEH